jgi:serine/threonine-protein kinase HipA
MTWRMLWLIQRIKKNWGSPSMEKRRKSIGLDEKQQENIFKKMEKSKSAWMKEVEISFLSGEFKKKYKSLLEERFLRLKE